MKSRTEFEPCEYEFEIPPFTKEMKKTHMILAPDIFPVHMDLLQAVFRMYGYNLVVLHYTGKQVIQKGLECIHNDMCYPLICLTGQQIYALTCGDFDPRKCALIQFQTGGGCRASNYIWLVRKALHNMGMDYVPVISLSFTQIEKSPGFRITPMMIVKGMVAIIYGDLLMLLRNQVRPYEAHKGETDALVERWNGIIAGQFKANKGLVGKKFRDNLHAIVRDFADIEKLNVRKTKVGIVGEIYVKYSPLGNNGLEAFLDSQNCEYMVPGVLPFFMTLFQNHITDHELYGGSRAKLGINRTLLRAMRKIEKAMDDALREESDFTRPLPFDELVKLGEKTLDTGVKMGEGWLLPAEIAELIEDGYSNVICAQPFGCLPNHIVAKGTARTIRNLYPDANLCPVDYDSGASVVNLENRIKLMLAMAAEKEGAV
ncbi:MAG: 2-hydroxyacyl-CoA dehydratase [Clostridia bacterium]|nr:2-hydroxyacyl-CoA dehydratase [Clostridia bacterium]